MAEDKIVQTIELQGADKVEKDFRDIGNAGEEAFQNIQDASEKTNFDKLGESVQLIAEAMVQLQEQMGSVIEATKQSAQANETYARSAESASQSTSNFVRNIVTIGAAVGAATASLFGLRSIFENVKQSMQDIANLSSAAKGMETTIDDVKRLEFVLRQMGLSASEARSKLEEISSESDNAGKNFKALNSGAKELLDSLRQSGVSFSQSKDGLNAMRDALAGMAQASTGGRIPLAELVSLIDKFKDKTDPGKLIDFANQLGNLAAQGKQVGQVLGDVSEGIGKVIRIPQLTDLDKATIAFKKFAQEMDVDSFKKFAEALAGIEDETKRLDKAVELLGPKVGKNLVDTMKELTDSGKSGSEVINALMGDFDKLRLSVGEGAEAIARKFNAAMDRLNQAVQQGRQELGLLIAPALTPVITEWTNLLRTSAGTITEWAKTIRDFAITAIQDLMKMLQGVSDSDISSKWMITARDSIVAFGTAVKEVFDSVVAPAIAGGVKLFQNLTEVINQTFGTSLSPAAVAIGAAITLLVGGVNALIIAFVTLFGVTQPGFEKTQETVAKMGLDISALKTAFTSIGTAISKVIQELLGLKEGSTVLEGINTVIRNIPLAIGLVAAAFVGLRSAADKLAIALKFAFGVEVTGPQLLLIGLVGELTGAFKGLGTGLQAVAAAFSIVGTSVTIVIGLFTTLATLNPFAAILIAITVFTVDWKTLVSVIETGVNFIIAVIKELQFVADGTAKALNALFGTQFTGGEVLITAIAAVAAGLIILRTRAIEAGAALALMIPPWLRAALLTLAAVLLIFEKDFENTNNALAIFEKKLGEVNEAFSKGKISAEDYREIMNKLHEEMSNFDPKTGNLDVFRARLNDIFQNIQQQSGSAASKLVDEWKKTGQKIADGLTGAAPQAGAAAKQAAETVTKPMVDTFKDAGDQIATNWKDWADKLGKVITVPQNPFQKTSDDITKMSTGVNDAIDEMIKGFGKINQESKGLVPPADQKRLEDSFDLLKKKVSEVDESLGKLPETAQLVSGKIGDLSTEIQTALTQATTTTDQATTAATNLAAQWTKVAESVTQAVTEMSKASTTPAGAAPGGGTTAGTGAPAAGAPGAGGTQATQFQQIDTLITTITAKIQQLTTGLTSAGTAVTSFVQGFLGIESISAALQTITTTVQSMAPEFDTITTAVNNLISVISQLVSSMQQLPSLVAQAFDASAVSGFTGAIEAAQSAVDSLVASLQSAIALSQALASMPSGGGGGNGGGGGGGEEVIPTGLTFTKTGVAFATGGRVWGSGGVDNIPAWLSRGEWVINAAAVRRLMDQFGQSIMPMINSGRLPIPKFALGGLVGGGPAMGFDNAGGGRGRELGILRLAGPDGREHIVHTDEKTAEELTRVARRSAMHATGRRPSFMT